jgi:dTMP kinase
VFICFEGSDGSGKGTQIDLFKKRLEKQFEAKVVTCREPGSTQISEQIREILLHKSNNKLHIKTETLLFLTARSQLIQEVIQPALNRNEIVICDRFNLSTLVYQGYATKSGFTIDEIKKMIATVCGDCQPDFGIVLDISYETMSERLKGKKKDRIEKNNDIYFYNVLSGFYEIGKENEYEIVDARGTKADVHNEVCKRFDFWFNNKYLKNGKKKVCGFILE